MKRRLAGLYFILSMTRNRGRDLARLERAIAGGIDILQVAAESGPRPSDVGMFLRARDLSREGRVPFLINGDLDLAVRVGADGVHMDALEVSPAAIRQKLGQNSIIGYTVGRNLESLRWAEAAGADYASFCALYPSTGAGQCELIPLETLREARSRTTMSLFASGGITPLNAAEVMRAGVDGIAVTGAIQEAEDPGRAAAELRRILRPFIDGRTVRRAFPQPCFGNSPMKTRRPTRPRG